MCVSISHSHASAQRTRFSTQRGGFAARAAKAESLRLSPGVLCTETLPEASVLYQEALGGISICADVLENGRQGVQRLEMETRCEAAAALRWQLVQEFVPKLPPVPLITLLMVSQLFHVLCKQWLEPCIFPGATSV